MGLQLEDGTGKGFQVEIDSDNHLHTTAICKDDATFESQVNGSHFCWTISDNTTGAEYVLAVQNNSTTQQLCIETIRGCSDTASIWTIAYGTWSTVGGGTEVVGENSNNTSGKTPDATAYMTATNLAVKGAPLTYSYAIIGSERIWRPDGKFVLGYNETIYIHNSAASTAYLTAHIHGYFKDLANA